MKNDHTIKTIPITVTCAVTKKEREEKEFKNVYANIEYFLEGIARNIPDLDTSFCRDLSEQSIYIEQNTSSLKLSYKNNKIIVYDIICTKTIDTKEFVLRQIKCHLRTNNKRKGRYILVLSRDNVPDIDIALIDKYIEYLSKFLTTGDCVEYFLLSEDDLK